MAAYWGIAAHSAYDMFSWYTHLSVILVFFPPLGLWSGIIFLIAPFPDHCLIVPFHEIVHSSAATSLGHPSANIKTDDEIQRFIEQKHRLYNAHIKMIPAQYPRKQPTVTFVRQSKPSLGTCEIPGLGRKSRRNSAFCRHKGHEEIMLH